MSKIDVNDYFIRIIFVFIVCSFEIRNVQPSNIFGLNLVFLKFLPIEISTFWAVLPEFENNTQEDLQILGYIEDSKKSTQVFS